MFDIGWGELLIVGVVALIVIGPKELPGVVRGIGQGLGKLRRMAADFQGQFQEAMREAELKDLQKGIQDIRDTASALNPMNLVQREIQNAMEPPKPTTATPPPTPDPIPPYTLPPLPPVGDPLAEAIDRSVADARAALNAGMAPVPAAPAAPSPDPAPPPQAAPASEDATAAGGRPS